VCAPRLIENDPSESAGTVSDLGSFGQRLLLLPVVIAEKEPAGERSAPKGIDAGFL
jgi:hypothetical protein